MSLSNAAGAAFFAARMTGAGEQPGRERPHLRTPDPDPRAGSGSLTSRLLKALQHVEKDLEEAILLLVMGMTRESGTKIVATTPPLVP